MKKPTEPNSNLYLIPACDGRYAIILAEYGHSENRTITAVTKLRGSAEKLVTSSPWLRMASEALVADNCQHPF